jgi:hypothetical protein
MKKKLLLVLGVGALGITMSSCWVLQSFTVLDYTLNIGQGTKAQFTLRPMADQNDRQFAFVIIGVGDTTAIGVGKATWGTNGQFNGPLPMGVSAPLPAAMGSQCQSNGLNFNTVTGITWKAYLTPQKIRDFARVEKKAVVQVNLKAKVGATGNTNEQLVGVSGIWIDDGDTTVDSGDTFLCNGIATSSVAINP